MRHRQVYDDISCDTTHSLKVNPFRLNDAIVASERLSVVDNEMDIDHDNDDDIYVHHYHLHHLSQHPSMLIHRVIAILPSLSHHHPCIFPSLIIYQLSSFPIDTSIYST